VTISHSSGTTHDLPAPRRPHDAAVHDLARRLDDAARAPRRAPLAAVAALAVVAATAVVAGPALAVLVALLALPVLGVVHQHDRARRTVTATYAQTSSRHECLVAMWERHRIAACVWEPTLWEIAPQGVHHTVARRVDGPRHLRADVALPTLAGAHRDVAFLPDRIVVREGRDHHVLAYDELEATATVRERGEGGRLGRLSLLVAGRAVTYDLASVAVAHELAAALRTLGALSSDVTANPWASPTLAL
jgi:hypothetical protein